MSVECKTQCISRLLRLLAAAAAVPAAGGASASAGALLEFSVQAFLEFLLGGVADGEDLAGEIEGLAGHGVIEVHHDAVVLDFMYLAVHYAALLVHHRYHVADCQETFLDLALYLKDVLGQLDYHVGVVLAVAFGGSEGELKGVTGLLAGYVLLELGQEISHAEDEVEGTVFCGLVGYLAVHCEGVGKCYYFLFTDFHCSALFDDYL